MENTKQKYNFADFKRRIARERRPFTPIGVDSYSRWGYYNNRRVNEDFTLEEIQNIIRSGDVEAARELSRYYYRTNGKYRNNIDFLASLPLYDTVVVPVSERESGSKTQIIKAFDNACQFVENLDVPNTFNHITKEWIKTGVFYGILRTDGINVIIQDLPLEYCRTRFKDFCGFNILEFNITYFEHIRDKELREEAILTFPEEIQSAWHLYELHILKDPWVMIPGGSGGICFEFTDDPTPLLLASIPDLKKLDDAVGREEKRDENELFKLLIQKMPIDNKGELVFQLEEVGDIHASVAEMLQDIDTVDVLTTFGDTTLESLQESSAASQSADRIEKYNKNAWNSLGRSSLIFNADGSSSLAYAIKKDESLMISYLNVYEAWIKFHLNDRFARNGLSFDFEILPTTVFNRQDLQSAYFRGAQYGYSKMFAGVAMGIKQRDQISLMEFENDFLEMSDKMKPLQSSYTTPGGSENSQEKNSSSAQKTTITTRTQDLENKGGRPELPDEQKSEKTQANIAAEG
ncbi:MAG: hypothetical protein J6T10_14035 [Methanobrevibacter sp.]|nr:hypothetical protein [Methanobrevibacter sp.]